MSDLSHSALIVLASRWLRSYCNCTVVITDMTSASPETPDAIGWREWRSTLIECKASRADFLADASKHFRRDDKRAMGNNRYYLAPTGMLTVGDIPEPWGLLETDGRRISIVTEAPTVHGGMRQYETQLLVSALRRMVCADGVRGIHCKTYKIETSAEPRATVGALPEDISP